MNIEGFNSLKEDNPVEDDNKYNFDYMIYNNNEKFEKNDEDDAEDNSIKIENDIQDGNVDNNIKK